MQIFNVNSSSKAGDHQLSSPNGKKNYTINKYVESCHHIFPATHARYIKSIYCTHIQTERNTQPTKSGNSYMKKFDILAFWSAKFVLMTFKVERVSNEECGVSAGSAWEVVEWRTGIERWVRERDGEREGKKEEIWRHCHLISSPFGSPSCCSRSLSQSLFIVTHPSNHP